MSFEYNIKSHPTTYAGVNFRSRLEARWACFFDLTSCIEWQYEPIDLDGWSPDFLLRLKGWKSWDADMLGCDHQWLAEVKPYTRLSQFKGHQCDPNRASYMIDNEPGPFGALLGINPTVSDVFFCRGSSAGNVSLYEALEDKFGNCWRKKFEEPWNEAGNRTQWIPKTKNRP